jgi:hypothetical protein
MLLDSNVWNVDQKDIKIVEILANPTQEIEYEKGEKETFDCPGSPGYYCETHSATVLMGFTAKADEKNDNTKYDDEVDSNHAAYDYIKFNLADIFDGFDDELTEKLDMPNKNVELTFTNLQIYENLYFEVEIEIEATVDEPPDEWA